MTVVNPKSISGINSVTMASGSDNLLTIHANDTSEKIRINSSGDIIVGSGVTLSPDGNIFATGITTIGTSDANNPNADGGRVRMGGGFTQLQVHAGSQIGVTTFVFGDTQVGSAVTDIAQFEISNKSNLGLAISQDDDSNIAYIRRRDNGGEIGFILRHGAQNRERLRIKGNGRVGIGTTLPQSSVDVNGTATVKGATVNSGSINMVSSHLQFSGQTSLPNVGATLFRPVADTIAFGINNGQRVSVNQYGLLFGTDTAAANALDDYEEGVHTVTITCNTSGTITLDTSHNKLAYHKIGNWINVHGRVRVASTSSPSGQQLRVSLPYQSASEYGGDASRITGFATIQNADENENHYGIQATFAGGSFVQIGNVNINTSNPTNVCSQVNSNSLIVVNVTYRTA